MCRIVGSLACIALLIAAIPYYAYLQKLLYPDGLLASGSLLFLACLCTKRYYGAAIVAVLLTLVKLIFIFTFAVIIFAWVYEKRNFNIKILAAASALCIFAAVFLFFSQIFYYRDWAFMVTFVRPTLAGIAPSEIIPPGGLRVTCGQSEHFVSSDRLNFVPILESQRTSPLGLLSEEDAVALRCTPAEIETLKLQSVLTALAYRPFLHAGLAVKYLINALVGRFLNGHAAYMVDWRGGLWVQNVNLLSLYPQSEIDQLDKYAREGFAFNLRRPNVIYYVSGIFEQWLEGLIRISVVVLLIAGLVILYRRNEINRFMIDRVSVSMMAFLLSYSACLAASAHSLSDRYTFPNFLVLSLLSARISMLALRGFDKQQ